MREIVKLFSDTGTLDDLGIGQVRDALGDLLFPGTSTVHARARYFLLVPWAFQKAAAKHIGTSVRTKANLIERSTIETLRNPVPEAGMIGAQAGKAIQTLPSSLYWAALGRYGILADPKALTWNVPIPAPAGFPYTIDEGLSLTSTEAEWLKERIVMAVPDSYLAYLLTDGLLADPYEFDAPWDHPTLVTAPRKFQDQIEHARLFSLAINGAALIYNQLIATKYDALPDSEDGYSDFYSERIEAWVTEMEAPRNEKAFENWDRHAFWQTVAKGRTLGRPVAPGTRLFINNWIDIVQANGARAVATDNQVRRAITDRERQNKGSQSRLQNERQLKNWGGSSGSNRLIYRWPNVQVLLADIREGIADATAG